MKASPFTVGIWETSVDHSLTYLSLWVGAHAFEPDVSVSQEGAWVLCSRNRPLGQVSYLCQDHSLPLHP